MSKLLTETVDDYRETCLSRSGMYVETETGRLFELGGGSHASCLVHDNGAVLTETMERMQGGLFPLTGRSLRHPFQEELADVVISMFGDDHARVYFTSGGTESVETAIRLAHHIQELRGRPDATMVIGHEYSYHGMSLLARNAGHHPIHSALPKALDFSWPKLPEPRCCACPLGLELDSCNIACASHLEELILRAGRENIAAVIVEPVSGTTGGALVPPLGYLDRISEICRREGIILIADETVTAFWRTGRAFVSRPEQVDIVVGGKCLAAGWAAIGCVLVTSGICGELRSFERSVPLRLTFAGNPLACLLALCVQRYMDQRQLGDRVLQNAPFIEEGLRAGCPPSGRIHGLGHLWGVEVLVEGGSGLATLETVKRKASLLSVEFMGGFKCGKGWDSVHVLLTPPFDAENSELIAATEMVTTLMTNL